MTIYIDLFWAGVLVGVFGTAALFFGVIIYYGIKTKKAKRL